MIVFLAPTDVKNAHLLLNVLVAFLLSSFKAHLAKSSATMASLLLEPCARDVLKDASAALKT